MSFALLREVHHVPGVRGWVRKQVLRSVARCVEWTTKLPGRGLNVSQVNDWLYVGGAVPRSRYAELKARGITAVIDVRGERCDDAEALKALGIELLNLPVTDRYPPSVEQLMRGVEWALPRLEQGGTLYTHCEHGVGRGPLVGLAVMVARGWEAPTAYRELRQARWQSTLNDRQLNGLADFVAAWQARTSERAA
ncbi:MULTISPECIES: dual specificity protein phosphatase [Myxococcus]|uniref:Dual specificity phosphatase n=1 Tax=Myxococcus xanthus (strain DK1622) TaxID=246197 RepID=Q1DF55_MYXXD|nr:MULTISPECIES: dual specificity protein phosphatase [Myxococcus]ABF89944.1 dual specificity phosphatase [Myxococcus xanthus DK 1622]NOJ53005.1 dual specificity protein phosphatase family protein [Myxococcus xanthus]NOK04190.1 dual specificity protein phosphatase family protein [Myxococcus xanthus]QPM80153.1 dual specificity protein phosphatase family protein [Myxococcus xanthus]QVW69217.1 dual specificity protein phosphatase family protein [Myxococcus xanthus DZ2]